MVEERQHRLALPKGTRIRDFEFHRVLGHGGFGITYLGWNTTLDIPVAIKEYFPADLATRERNLSVVPQTAQAAPDFKWGLERFLDEARTLARFQHPGIVRIHHFFEAHRTAYIAMDYVEGESLSAYLQRKGTLSEGAVKGILDPLLGALEVVHQADFLHRDIKPGNIVLREKDGSPVLLDFGAARQAMGARSRSVTSIVTPGYAPIEQYSTRAAQGAWTDIYALGGVCYRALTGESPFDATDRMRNDPLVPAAERCAGKASPGFLAAIDTALEVDAPDRPQSIAAWRESLSSAEKAPADGTGDAAGGGGNMVPSAWPFKSWKNLPFKPLAAVLGLVALLIGGQRYLEHSEGVALKEEPQKQAALEKQAQEQAALEKQRKDREALEKQQREQAALEEQRRKQAALKKKRQEQAALQKRTQEQAALQKQRQEQAAMEKQQEEQGREQAASRKKRQEQDAPKKQAQEQAALEKQRQEQAFVAEVGRPPHPDGMNKGEPDLHVAAKLNLPLLTVSLLEQGADIHAKNKDGWTPLHVAARENASTTAEVLLLQKADVNARETLFGWTPLHLAAAREDASATAEVLLKHGADVNAKDKFGWTPLHSAASNDAYETAEALLKDGADVNAEDNHGWEALYWADRKKAFQAAEVLRRYGGREQDR